MEFMDAIIIAIFAVAAIVILYGILDVRRDIRRVKRVLEDNSKLLK